MQRNDGYISYPRHAKKDEGRFLPRRAPVVAAVAAIAILAAIGFFTYSHFLDGSFRPLSNTDGQASSPAPNGEDFPFDEVAVSDVKGPEAHDVQEQAGDSSASLDGQASAEEEADDALPTPLVAQYGEVNIHSPIRPQDINGILFHQASYEYALQMQTELGHADPDTVEETKDFGIADEQPTGDEYIRANALHLWRETDSTEMDTSIDVGALAGTQVYAPVTGTVVLVKEYDLYDTCLDFEVHIQPDGYVGLDVVELHLTDIAVRAGERVEGGVTPLARVRDLAAEDITDIQIGYYTAVADGNHTHIQVNDADYEGYRKEKLKGAISVG